MLGRHGTGKTAAGRARINAGSPRRSKPSHGISISKKSWWVVNQPRWYSAGVASRHRSLGITSGNGEGVAGWCALATRQWQPASMPPGDYRMSKCRGSTNWQRRLSYVSGRCCPCRTGPIAWLLGWSAIRDQKTVPAACNWPRNTALAIERNISVAERRYACAEMRRWVTESGSPAQIRISHRPSAGRLRAGTNRTESLICGRSGSTNRCSAMPRATLHYSRKQFSRTVSQPEAHLTDSVDVYTDDYVIRSM